jgi:diacylglycerol kinase family enzyme
VLGGDGTFNTALQGMLMYENSHPEDDPFERVEFAYIPVGSSNDLARGLEYPKKPVEIFRGIMRSLKKEEGRFDQLDIGKLTYLEAADEKYNGKSRYFAVSCGMGLDASVCEEAMHSRAKKALNKFDAGALSYPTLCVKQLALSPITDITIEDKDTGEKKRMSKSMLVAVMNHKYQGGGLMFAPDASCDDGIFDYVYTNRLTRREVAMALPKMYKGTHTDVDGVFFGKGSRLAIRCGEELYVHTDGEVETKAVSIEVECMQKRLCMVKYCE